MRASQKFMIACLLMAVITFTTVSSSISLLSGGSGLVINTFTFETEEGSIAIELDETDINDTSKRTDGNNYTITKGETVSKDPTATIKAGSVDSYVFIYMDNPLSADFTINYSDSWTLIASNENKSLYMYNDIVESSEDDQKLTPLFTEVTVPSDISDEDIASFGTKTMTLQAYAIEADTANITEEGAINEATAKFGLSSSNTNVSED
ncbi:MAG: hypothetical protein LUG60_00345 [Erysipelotrichaceae bacterium]|nr:hypothetical protein [Erysipelotrichaceae bacterium]